jgi:hypothetical protein
VFSLHFVSILLFSLLLLINKSPLTVELPPNLPGDNDELTAVQGKEHEKEGEDNDEDDDEAVTGKLMASVRLAKTIH